MPKLWSCVQSQLTLRVWLLTDLLRIHREVEPLILVQTLEQPAPFHHHPLAPLSCPLRCTAQTQGHQHEDHNSHVPRHQEQQND